MAKDPSFPFYAQDFLIDTLRWSRDMQGLHVALIAESWANGGLLNENEQPLGLGSTDVHIWFKIKHKWYLKDGMWFNAKLEEVRAARESFREKQREKGVLSGKKRNQKQATVQPKTSHGSTVVEPIESECEKESEKNKKRVAGKDWRLPDVPGEDLVWPFESLEFKMLWAVWKEYRHTTHGKDYAAMHSEQAALKMLSIMGEAGAIQTIEAAMAGKWENLYPQNHNGNGNSKNRKESTGDLAAAFAERVRKQNSNGGL